VVFSCNGLKIPCFSILVHMERRVLESSIRLCLAESAVSPWVAVVLHAVRAAVGPLLKILLVVALYARK